MASNLITLPAGKFKGINISLIFSLILEICKMKLLFIRHGQSESNLNKLVLYEKSDPLCELTEIGIKQAKEVADFLKDYISTSTYRIWHSPLKRARQTSDIISGDFKKFSKESLYLTERNLGLVSTELYKENFENEHQFYEFYKNSEQSFLLNLLGESPYDLCLRVGTFLEIFDRNLFKHCHYNYHVLITHKAVIKAFRLMLLDLPHENFDTIEPDNCEIFLHEYGTKFFNSIFKPTVK